MVRLCGNAGGLVLTSSTPSPATQSLLKNVYGDDIPAIYQLKNFALDEGRRHRHDLCRVCCRALQRVDQHHDQPGLLLGRRNVRRRAEPDWDNLDWADADADGAKAMPRTFASGGEAAAGYRRMASSHGGLADLFGSPDLLFKFCEYKIEELSPMIELKDIVVKFGDFEALHNINVHVKEGRVLHLPRPVRLRQDHHAAHHHRLY